MYPKRDVTICLGSSCFSRGNKKLLQHIQKYIRDKNLREKVNFRGDHCFDKCSKGPNLKIGDKFYHEVNSDNVFDYLMDGLKDII